MPDEPPRANLANLWRINRFTHASYRPYVTGIGQAALAWNKLQDDLGQLFTALVAGRFGVTLAAWYAIDSDRGQRKMVEKAAKAALRAGQLNQGAYDAISWLLAESNKLAESRNDIIHSPLESRTNQANERLTEVGPKALFGILALPISCEKTC